MTIFNLSSVLEEHGSLLSKLNYLPRWQSPLLLTFLVLDFFSYPSSPKHLSSSFILLGFLFVHKHPGFNRAPRSGSNFGKSFIPIHSASELKSPLRHPFCFASHINSIIQLSPMQVCCCLFLPPCSHCQLSLSWFLSSHTWMSTEAFYSILHTAAKSLFKRCFRHCIPLPQISNGSFIMFK